MKIKVLISDPLSKEGIKLLEENDLYEVSIIKPEELKDKIEPYDALIIRSGSKVTEEVLNHAKNLKIIGRAGVGVDNIDIKAASKKGIIVMNTPFGNTISAAEHTMSMMMSLVRNIPMAHLSLKNKEWKRSKFTGTELYKKTLGVIGFGKIGFEVAKRARSFEMNILVYDPFATKEQADKLNAKIVDLDYLLQNSDIITLHIPKTKDTENLINKETISKMKEGVRILNVARGGIINENDLKDALLSGKVKGAAIDVFSVEPALDSPLIDLDNVVVTPHLGASTEEAQINVAVDIVKQIRDFFENKEIKNAVNAFSFSPEIMKEIEPFIFLAEKIGILETAFLDDESGIKEIEIYYKGNISEKTVSPITASLLKGLLKNVEEHINLVNASFLANERGIKIKEIKANKLDDIANLLTVKVKTNKKEVSVSGTVFYKNNIRIIKINNYNVDLSPFGNIIISKNLDVPGVVGKLGTKLQEEGINISNMQVSTNKMDNQAIMLTSIDKKIDNEVLLALRDIKEIELAKFVIL